MTGNPQEPSEFELDDFEEDDLFEDDLDAMVSLVSADLDTGGFGNSKRLQKTAKRKRRNKPEQWEDDWCDPADDLMFGFDDTQEN